MTHVKSTCHTKESNLETTVAKGPQAYKMFVLQARVFTLDPYVSLGLISSRHKNLHYFWAHCLGHVLKINYKINRSSFES